MTYPPYEPLKERENALKCGKIEGMKVLEIGTGKGMTAILAAKKFNCDVTAIDTDEESLLTAWADAEKEGLSNKIKFLNCYGRKTLFEDLSFDAVIMFNSLHHCKSGFADIIKEAMRLASKKIVISELNNHGAEAFDKSIHPGKDHASKLIDIDEIERMVESKFEIEKFESKIIITLVCRRK